MPTIASSSVPPPKAWDEFEDICLSASKLRWDSTDFYRNGRPGQKQDGVDIWGADDDRNIAVQCKNTIDGVTLAVVVEEVGHAEDFKPELDHLYIATTAKRDAPLQRAVRELSHARRRGGQFKVDVLFWDDICSDLGQDDDVFFKHYPQFKQGSNLAKEHDGKLFAELTALLRTDGVIGFLDRNNMAGFAFRSEELDPLREFYFNWSAPEREFLSPELEKIRSALWSKIDTYYDVIAQETFAASNPHFQTVPPEWEIEQPERFWRVVNVLHTLAREIVAQHGDLVRTGRAILLGSHHRNA